MLQNILLGSFLPVSLANLKAGEDEKVTGESSDLVNIN